MTTVLRITMRTPPIPVTVGIFEARREHEGPKVTTVTRMAAMGTHSFPTKPNRFGIRYFSEPSTSPVSRHSPAAWSQ